MESKVTPSGNILVEIKLLFKPEVYEKVKNIVELSDKYNDLEHMISKMIARELGVYNGVTKFIDKFVTYIDDRMEGRVEGDE